MKQNFAVGNQVRVTEGGTLYVITQLLPGGGCFIRQHGKAPNGKQYAEQQFDTSLLKHAVTDEMLSAFSFGRIKAAR